MNSCSVTEAKCTTEDLNFSLELFLFPYILTAIIVKNARLTNVHQQSLEECLC